MAVNNPGGGGSNFSQGTLAARPAVPAPNQLYFATDTGEWWVGNTAGTAWQSLGRTSSTAWGVGGVPGGVSYGVNGNDAMITSANNDIQPFGNGDFGVVSGNLRCISAGKGLKVSEGANGKQGTATLVAGTVTIANTSITANSRILITPQETGALTGILRVSARVVGTSFTITSSVNTDTALVAWEIFEPG